MALLHQFQSLASIKWLKHLLKNIIYFRERERERERLWAWEWGWRAETENLKQAPCWAWSQWWAWSHVPEIITHDPNIFLNLSFLLVQILDLVWSFSAHCPLSYATSHYHFTFVRNISQMWENTEFLAQISILFQTIFFLLNKAKGSLLSWILFCHSSPCKFCELLLQIFWCLSVLFIPCLSHPIPSVSLHLSLSM